MTGPMMTMNDDDSPLRPARFTPLPLDRLGVDELRRYIADMQSEIIRVEAEIAKKQDYRSAADSFFKQKGPG